MTVIHIEKVHLEKVLSMLEHHVEVMPVVLPDTHYVDEQVVELLEREQIPFKRITDENIVRFAERMLNDSKQALEDIHEGRSIEVTVTFPLTPQSMRKILESAKERARRSGLI
jgi:hypothetical protein